jgi:spore maturation protein CgeB
MRLVIFGLTMSSSWGNGHATLWRGLCRALARRGDHVTFFERDVPYYASHRDLIGLDGTDLVIYPRWEDVATAARDALLGADAALVTSYCPDALAATRLVLGSNTAVKAFYDLDTPVTLERLRAGEKVEYLGPRGLADFDLVLSYTGGAALSELRDRLGARRVAPLYGSVDPDQHRPAAPSTEVRADLSYLGTFAADRQDVLARLLIDAARALPDRRFLLGGSKYPDDFPWTENLFYWRHVAPPDHPWFYASSRLTLNVTRAAMASLGWCPSGRLFEAAACGVPIVTDAWEGLDAFFAPGGEILVASDTADVVRAIETSDAELLRISTAARERTLAEHTAERRASELVGAHAEARAPVVT